MSSHQTPPQQLDYAPTPTGVEALVCRDIAMRQAMGTRKYGTTLQDNPAPLTARLQHLYEELLDGANYAKWCMLRLDARSCAAPDALPAPLPVPSASTAYPVQLSLTITAPSRTAAAMALRDLAWGMADGGHLLPGEFCIKKPGGAVVHGELNQLDLSGDRHV